MSRRMNGGAGKPVPVETDGGGRPLSLEGLPILDISDHYREWVGILEGGPQRDIWHVKTAVGIAELHFVCQPASASGSNARENIRENVGEEEGVWLLYRWED